MKSFLYLAVSNDLFYVSSLVTLLPHVSYVCKFITAMDDIDLSTSSEISFMFGFFFAVSHLFCFEISRPSTARSVRRPFFLRTIMEVIMVQWINFTVNEIKTIGR